MRKNIIILVTFIIGLLIGATITKKEPVLNNGIVFIWNDDEEFNSLKEVQDKVHNIIGE